MNSPAGADRPSYALGVVTDPLAHRLRLRWLRALACLGLVGLLFWSGRDVAEAADIALAWDAPTLNEDGTPLSDLAGFRVYKATRSGVYDGFIDVGPSTHCTYPNLTGGIEYYFAVTAYDRSGNESAFSTELRTVAPVTSVPATSRQPTLAWPATPGVEWYHLWVNDEHGVYYSSWLHQASSTWTFETELPCGEYTWWVQSWTDSQGEGPWLGPYTMSLPCCLPAKPALLMPAVGCNAGGALQYMWATDPCSAYYHLWVERDGVKWSSQWLEVESPGDPLGVAVPGHAAGRYTWWVQGAGEDGLGAWSEPRSFDVGVAEPLAPQGSVAAPQELTWDDTCSGTPSWYQFWINQGTGLYWSQWVPASVPDFFGGFGRYDLPVELEPGEYTWWLQTWEDGRAGPWSEEMSFSVD